jgi:PilZ domain
MERRDHARIAHKSLKDITVTFSGQTNGTGMLYDVSTGGCKVQSDSTPPLGASLTLRLAVSPKAGPVKIDAAIVGWTIKDQYFGVKFLDIKPSERLVLDQFIAHLGVSGTGLFDIECLR